MKGCYCLIIYVKKYTKIKIGKLNIIEFKKGTYVYIGSALNSLQSRLNRHLSEDKKLHWHIDYLLIHPNTHIMDIIYNISPKKVECDLSQYLSQKTDGIENFGCSDCECQSHLYYFKTKKEAIEQVKNAYDSIAMDYQFFKK